MTCDALNSVAGQRLNRHSQAKNGASLFVLMSQCSSHEVETSSKYGSSPSVGSNISDPMALSVHLPSVHEAIWNASIQHRSASTMFLPSPSCVIPSSISESGSPPAAISPTALGIQVMRKGKV